MRPNMGHLASGCRNAPRGGKAAIGTYVAVQSRIALGSTWHVMGSSPRFELQCRQLEGTQGCAGRLVHLVSGSRNAAAPKGGKAALRTYFIQGRPELVVDAPSVRRTVLAPRINDVKDLLRHERVALVPILHTGP